MPADAPITLTADCFACLRLRWGAEPAPGEVPGAIEHLFDAGRMVDHYLVTPAPALWALPGVPEQAQTAGIVFCQQTGEAPWQVLLHRTGGGTPAEAQMSAAEFAALLAANGIVLPGEPGFVPPPAPAQKGPQAADGQNR